MNEVGNIGFLITVLLRVDIEHKLCQRSVQPRKLTAHDRKTAARQACGAFKIQSACSGANIGVVAHREIKLTRCAPPAQLEVVIFALAHRHAVMR